MKLDIISLIFILIIFGCVMGGLKQGFFKIVINLIKGILSFALAILLAKPIAELLSNTFIGQTINSHLNEAFLNQGGVFSITITEANKAEVLKHALSEIHIPEFLSNMLSNFMSNLVEVNGSVSVAEALSSSLTHYILIAIAFILVFILVNILCAILKGIFKKLEKLPLIGTANKVLGAILNGVIGVIVVCFITFGITLIIPFSNEFATWFADTIMLNDPETATIAKFFYENNFILKIIAYLQSLMA